MLSSWRAERAPKSDSWYSERALNLAQLLADRVAAGLEGFFDLTPLGRERVFAPLEIAQLLLALLHERLQLPSKIFPGKGRRLLAFAVPLPVVNDSPVV